MTGLHWFVQGLVIWFGGCILVGLVWIGSVFGYDWWKGR